ncbi:hypothetical protein TNIN_424801, partial [Trichonephila inaurata madagascariensis]
FHR